MTFVDDTSIKLGWWLVKIPYVYVPVHKHYASKAYGRHWMMVSGQAHAPATLLLGKELPMPSKYEAEQSQSGCDGEEKNPAPACCQHWPSECNQPLY
jgi:hypothetical protein